MSRFSLIAEAITKHPFLKYPFEERPDTRNYWCAIISDNKLGKRKKVKWAELPLPDQFHALVRFNRISHINEF